MALTVLYSLSGIFPSILESDSEDNVLTCGSSEGAGEYLTMGLHGRDLWSANNTYILWNSKQVFEEKYKK